MAYTPINWQTGGTITAEKLNRCDNGWGYESTQLFSETVTTVAGQYGYSDVLVYGNQIDADTIVVTFDGADYTCTAIDAGGGAIAYGGMGTMGPDFTEYPFLIMSAVSAGDSNVLYTETAGAHTISATAATIEISDDFATAVNESITVDTSTIPLLCIANETTISEAAAAKDAGRLLYFWTASNGCFFITALGLNCTIFPTSANVTAGFGRNDGLFYFTES